MPISTEAHFPWPNSLWMQAAHSAPVRPKLAAEVIADVTIIGAGFTGLRAALHLAQSGTRVVLLDGGDVGWGASGRTGGQVNPMLPFNSPAKLRDLLGTTYFERLTEVSLHSADELFDMIATNKIDCQARQHGWLRVNHNDRARRKSAKGIREWNAFGAGMEMLDGDDIARISGSQIYGSGVLTPRGGAVHPMMLVQGMAARCRDLGVQIFGQTTASAIVAAQDGWMVRTDQGSVRSDWVIVATNGYTGPLVPKLGASIIPLTPIQIATPPLSASMIETILPQGHTISDSRRIIMFARREPDNRIVYGGLGKQDRAGKISGFDWLIRDATRVFPQLAGVDWAYRWGGQIAVTEDHLPHLHEPEKGLLIGLGYNGRGVAMANVMGRVMAQRVLGAAAQSLPFPITGIRGFSLRALKTTGMGTATGVMRFMDWLETR